jgi:hypothetical protein
MFAAEIRPPASAVAAASDDYGRRTQLHYNGAMANTPAAPADQLHDDTLIDWFLSLQPAERLAELESRLAFFAAARRHVEPELPQDSRAT